MASVFETLNNINVNEHIENKNGLSYLSWAWAWAKVKAVYPEVMYKVYENKDEWNYFTDGKTCWVKTSVSILGQEYIDYLPVMDFKNKSIPADQVTSFDVNKAIQRSLTKALARHGLGLYIYAGEDLPEFDQASRKAVGDKMELVKAELIRTGYSINSVIKTYKLNDIKDITLEQIDDFLAKMKGVPSKDGN